MTLPCSETTSNCRFHTDFKAPRVRHRLNSFPSIYPRLRQEAARVVVFLRDDGYRPQAQAFDPPAPHLLKLYRFCLFKQTQQARSLRRSQHQPVSIRLIPASGSRCVVQNRPLPPPTNKECGGGPTLGSPMTASEFVLYARRRKICAQTSRWLSRATKYNHYYR